MVAGEAAFLRSTDVDGVTTWLLEVKRSDTQRYAAVAQGADRDVLLGRHLDSPAAEAQASSTWPSEPRRLRASSGSLTEEDLRARLALLDQARALEARAEVLRRQALTIGALPQVGGSAT